MHRAALALAVAGCLAVVLRAPGHFLAIGLAIAAIGTGLVGYQRRGVPGQLRLVAAGAITLGCLALLLGTVRVVLVLAAIDHVGNLLPPIAT
jgi:hypothetical protein